jgi:DNA-directed RNA polymerase subunit omega
MARITIEDCMEHVPNRFHLVRMASIRAKQLKKGALPLLTSEDNKQVVMSLREIAAGLVKPIAAEVSAEDTEGVAETITETPVAAEAVQTEAVPAVEPEEPTPAG